MAALAVGLLLIASRLPAQAGPAELAGWRQQLSDMRELLLENHWMLVRNQSTHLLHEMVGAIGPSGAEARELLAAASAQRAIAEAGRGNGAEAMWSLQIAQALNPVFREASFTEFGRAGLFLEGVREVWQGPRGPRGGALPLSEVPRNAELPRFTEGSFIEYSAPAEVLTTWDRELRVEFVIDEEGFVRAPVVYGKIEHVAPILASLWTLKSWRFVPGKVGGQASKFLYQVPLPITERTIDRVEAEFGAPPIPAGVAQQSTAEQPTAEVPVGSASPSRPAELDSVSTASVEGVAVLAAAESAVRNWADAWSKQDVDGYLAAYSEKFSPADGSALHDWSELRRSRIEKPTLIEVELGPLEGRLLGIDRVEMVFQQRYRSNTFADEVRKTLVLIEEAGSWRIVSERSD